MTTRHVVQERIRAEFLEMPCMSLTLTQVARLCGIEQSLCQAALDALVEAEFLVLKPDGTYVRRTEEVGRARAARPPMRESVPSRVKGQSPASRD